jgi:hypothetical protein
MKPAVRNKKHFAKIAFRLSEEDIRNISSLGEVLRGIRARLKKEGVDIDKSRKKLLSKCRNKVKYRYEQEAE